jgi:hypothetical protein
MRLPNALLIALMLFATPAIAQDTYVVDFDAGAQGWVGPGGSGGATSIDTEGGNPGANMHTVFNNFFVTFANSTNPEFVRNLTKFQNFTFSIDLKVQDISFFGTPVTRPWVLEIRNHDNPPAGYPFVSVWYLFDWVGQGDWTTWSVHVEDPRMVDLPKGWSGTGAEDPVTLEPRLPEDRTFADVLAGADEIVFTTAQPGYVFGFTDFDLRIDNVSITTQSAQPCPADIDNNGVVDAGDLGILLVLWGHAKTAADLNHDGIVNAADLGILLVEWGPCS